MNIIVQSKTLAVTSALRSFVEQQVEKLIRRGQKVTSITVFLEAITRKKSDQNATAAKLCIKVPGRTLFIQRQAHDLYQAVADASSRADRVLRKMKEKREDAFRYRARNQGRLASIVPSLQGS